METITKQQFKDALLIVEQYERQVREAKIHNAPKQPYDVGCRVKLSAWGIEMQGKKKSKLVGTVIDYIPWIMNPKTDGLAIVKWDIKATPDEMHVSQLESLPPKTTNTIPVES